MKFIENNGLIYSISSNNTFSKIAAFDLDSTIIKTKSGKIFPIDKNDWEFLNNYVKEVLYNLFNNCYKIIIFTNKKDISKDINKKKNFIDKIENIRKELNFDFDIFMSTDDDYYRKPMTGMWDTFIDLYPIKIDKNNSFYCGDAAGRNNNWINGKKKDFSICDLYFAHNIGLKFEIPENIFKSINQQILNYNSLSQYDNFDLENLIKTNTKSKIIYKPADGQELIIIMGRQGSGKTKYSKDLLSNDEYKNYIYINQDTHKTKSKCKKIVEEALINKKSLLIDNTNPDKKSREEYIKMAKKYNKNIYVTLYFLDFPEYLSKHLNNFRVQKSKGNIKNLSQIVFRIYNKKFEEPHLNEDINKIIKIPFIFQGNKDDEKLFLYHYHI